jgi:putative transposase
MVENLVQRAFSAETRNVLWVGDITYIPLQHGFLYFTWHIDVFSRKAVGWAMKTRMTEQLLIDPLLASSRPGTTPSGVDRP